MKYEALAEEVINARDSQELLETENPCSIVVSKAPSEETVGASSTNRNSIVSTSSIDSTRSDNTETDVAKNIEYGTSIFYVNWDE